MYLRCSPSCERFIGEEVADNSLAFSVVALDTVSLDHNQTQWAHLGSYVSIP